MKCGRIFHSCNRDTRHKLGCYFVYGKEYDEAKTNRSNTFVFISKASLPTDPGMDIAVINPDSFFVTCLRCFNCQFHLIAHVTGEVKK